MMASPHHLFPLPWWIPNFLRRILVYSYGHNQTPVTATEAERRKRRLLETAQHPIPLGSFLPYVLVPFVICCLLHPATGLVAAVSHTIHHEQHGRCCHRRLSSMPALPVCQSRSPHELWVCAACGTLLRKKDSEQYDWLARYDSSLECLQYS
jgi:hypothetical protein